MEANLILSHQQIDHKIRRIALQLIEAFSEEDEIIIAGISGNGYLFAQKITDMIASVSSLKTVLCEVKMDKTNPFSTITTSLNPEVYQNKGIALVDDVLNTGTTLIYGIRYFLDVPLKKFKTAVLIDRNHKKYPVKADFKGLSLSTSLMEHVQVVFDDNNSYAYLTQ